MSSAIEALLIATITVTLAGAVGYGFFRLMSPRDEPANPLGLGRRWFAWTGMIVTFATLPSFFRLLDANSIAKWILSLAFFGGLAFGSGWLYGRFFKFNATGIGNSSGPDEAGPQAANGTTASGSEPRTHYHNLQVSENATLEVIKGAYKYLVQKWHPDRNPDNSAEAERITHLINEAYVVLSNPQLRKEHDEWIRSEREKARSNSYPEGSQQSSSATWARGSAVRRLVAVSAVFIAIAAAGVFAWDYTSKATNRDLCIDLVRFIADLHDDIADDKAEKAENLHGHAFRATEHLGSATRRLERWQSDSNEHRLVVVQKMQLALSNYRRLAELYHAAASGNFVDQEAILAEMNVKRDAVGSALLDAVGSAVLGSVIGPSNTLTLSTSGRRDIRETVELLFATELAQSRNDPQYKAGSDVWAAIFLYRSLK